jgi:hypothetical protein
MATSSATEKKGDFIQEHKNMIMIVLVLILLVCVFLLVQPMLAKQSGSGYLFSELSQMTPLTLTPQ